MAWTMRYMCPECKEELVLDGVQSVVYVEPEVGAGHYWAASPITAGDVDINYECPQCGPKPLRFVYYPEALRRLWGGGVVPELPWHREPPAPERMSDLERWAWEMEHTPDAHTFLLFCRGKD